MPNNPAWPQPQLGRRVKQLRETVREVGLSQDQLAEEIRLSSNLNWTRAVIAAIEGGTRHVDLGEIVVLASVLKCSITDLLTSTEEWVEIAGTTYSPEAIQKILGGTPPSLLPFDQIKSRLDPKDEKFPRSRVGVHLASASELERLMAGRLDVEPAKVALVAAYRWGHSVTQEREIRAGDRPERRQHVSRQLLKEIEEGLQKGEDRKAENNLERYGDVQGRRTKK